MRYKFIFGRGSAPDPTEGAHDTPPKYSWLQENTPLDPYNAQPVSTTDQMTN